MAERTGFEPAITFPLYTLSKRAPSTTRPPLRTRTILSVILVLMNEPSIFTKIINGEIPCHRIYEDELTFAFLDIHPRSPGHTLIVPKKQIEFVWDLDDATYTAVMHSAKLVAERIREVIQLAYVGEQVIGMDVPHAHVQVFGFETAEDYFKQIDMTNEPDHKALAAIAERLRF